VKLRVFGRVQGVGFRPFVYRLAVSLDLKGYVLNSSKGVEILIQGDTSSIEKFIEDLFHEAPPLSVIDRIEKEYVKSEPYSDFTIKKSRKEEGFVFISPDIAVCEDCLLEMRDPKDRRYRYPFINCTNCGPRYTIIEDIPYDRPKTTMKKFKMCKLCEEEYHNPLSRRFHAQPNSCFDCGPSLWIDGLETKDIFKEISELLKNGKILAIKGLGGFHIACDATDKEVVSQLRERKKRPHKPFALMMKDMDMVRRYCYVSEKEERILKSPQSPIVLLKIKELKDIVENVAPQNKYLGVMLPYTPYHYLMFDYIDFPIVMTSANISDEPIIKDNEDAKKNLGHIVDFYVMHDRDIKHRVDDSVVFVENGVFQIIRRSRGYAPDPVKLPIKVRPALALGPELKNTFTLAKDDIAIPSPHIGDLKNKETLDVFEETINEYIKLFKIEPEVVISDMHPAYMTSQIAENLKTYVEVIEIQHHRAHIFSLMLDNGYTGDIIGFSFDGTGYGDDGKVWGGEVFTGDINGLDRVFHFEYFPIAGGDSAIQHPGRIALSYFFEFMPHLAKKIEHRFTPFEIEAIEKMVKAKKVFYTSSLGRIFDLVAGILGIMDKITYEAQAAIYLEMLAMESDTEKVYPFVLKDDEIRIRPMIEAIFNDMNRGMDRAFISRRFHNTIVKIIHDTACMLREKTYINTLGFSGGVFQNRLLLHLLMEKFKEHDFAILLHKNVPPNDGGVSLGQLVMAKY